MAVSATVSNYHHQMHHSTSSHQQNSHHSYQSPQQQHSRCFICGSRIGRGNQTSLRMEERMDKLISVSQTVEHSSTIISDILSRILNETVILDSKFSKYLRDYLDLYHFWFMNLSLFHYRLWEKKQFAKYVSIY